MNAILHMRLITACFIGMPIAAFAAAYESLHWPGVPWVCGGIFTLILLAFTVLAVMPTRNPFDVE